MMYVICIIIIIIVLISVICYYHDLNIYEQSFVIKYKPCQENPLKLGSELEIGHTMA